MDWPFIAISFFAPLILLVIDITVKWILFKNAHRTAGSDVGLCGIAVILPTILIWAFRSNVLTGGGLLVSFIYGIGSVVSWLICLLLCSTESKKKIRFSYSLGVFTFVLCFYYKSILLYFDLFLPTK
jgi:hypothetical protein